MKSKRKFSYPERYAVWHCQEHRCWLCHEPLRLIEATIDHVLPESLLDDDERRETILAEYGLPATFDINSFQNWLPCHARCNQSKGSVPPVFVPGNKFILDRLMLLAPRVKRVASEVTSNIAKEKVFARIFAALEKQTLTMLELYALLDAFIEEPEKAGVPEDVVVLDSGYWVRKENLAGEGLCRCERKACVGSTKKIYCYFPRTLPAWVVRTGLYWKCYDEFITCSRCSKQHKRGHVGREDVCGRPYLNQEAQTD